MNGPSHRVTPGPGQESVWDYPRPPRLERVPERLRVVFAGETVADTTHGWRLLETSHPPVYYLPRADVLAGRVEPSGRRTRCEFKGTAVYWTLVAGERRSEDAAWSYPEPPAAFAGLRDTLAFYASRVDACYVGDERVQAQQGDYYGGWITRRVVGPFKGAAGTWGW